jgi:hypothetical protein
MYISSERNAKLVSSALVLNEIRVEVHSYHIKIHLGYECFQILIAPFVIGDSKFQRSGCSNSFINDDLSCLNLLLW